MSPNEIAQALTQQIETANILFRFSTGDSVDSDWQQRFHDWITQYLGVQLSGKLRYNKYTGRGQMEQVTGNSTNGFAEPEVNAVHSIFERDGHEAIHVYSARVGRPSDFFNEGLAVALNTEPFVEPFAPPWNGMHVHSVAKDRCAATILCPALTSIIATDGFRDFPESTTYPLAGSFLLYLIEQDGIGPMLQFFGAGSRDQSRGRIENNFQAAWGMSVAEAEAAWRAFLVSWSG